MKEITSIVIPIFESGWTEAELQIVKHCHYRLEGFSFVFAAGQKAEVTSCQNTLPDAVVYKFADSFFQNDATFASLLQTKDFYERLAWSEFAFILRPNSLITKNELRHWCRQGYDFIQNAPLAPSLRRIEKFMNLAKSRPPQPSDSVKVDDLSFWEKKSWAFWNGLRTPPNAIRPYFSKAYDEILRSNTEEVPFLITGFDRDPTALGGWLK